MTGNELLQRVQALVAAGYGDEEVFIDYGAEYELTSIEEVDIDSDGDGIVIWKLTEK